MFKGLNLYQLQSTIFNIEVPSHTETQIFFYTSEGAINVSTFLKKKVCVLIAPENQPHAVKPEDAIFSSSKIIVVFIVSKWC